MEAEKIKIKCPNCGAVLVVKKVSGIEKVHVTCQACKKSSPFMAYKLMVPPAPSYESDDSTRPNLDESTRPAVNGGTVLPKANYILGKLVLQPPLSGSYQLKPGKTVIGRQTSSSTADFKINTGDSRRMSREHIVIEVKKVPGQGYVHYVSLYKEKVNDTFICKERIDFSECLILRHGDVIELPDAVLKFELPDDDMTDI